MRVACNNSTRLAQRFCLRFKDWAYPLLPRATADSRFGLQVLALAATLWLAASFWVQFIPSADLWWLLATGRLQVDVGGLPVRDPFSWSASGHVWHNDQWLPAVSFYILYTFGGLGLLHAFKALLLSLTWLVGARTGIDLLPPGRAGWIPAAMLGTALALNFSEARYFFDVRAYLFTYLALMILWRWILLEQLVAWKIVLLFVGWANLHGGVSSGLLLLGLSTVVSRNPRQLALLALAVLASLCNPSGPGLLLHPLKLLGSYWGRHLNEWAPAWRQPELFRWHLAHLALWMGIFAFQRGPRRHQWLLAAMGVFSLTGWRHIPLFAWLSLPLWIEFLAPKVTRVPHGFLSVAFFLIAGLRPLALFNPLQSLEGPMFPQAASEFLRAQSYGPRLFHPYGFGGYLLWKLHPQYQVAIDGRAVQSYPWQVYQDYLRAAYNRDRLLDYCQRHKVDTVMLFTQPVRVEANRKLLEGVKGWSEVYRDPLCSIYRRSML